MVGERGFEPPIPWSRTWGRGADFVNIQSFEWCFNRLILAQSRQFWRNVNPPIATLARVSFPFGGADLSSQHDARVIASACRRCFRKVRCGGAATRCHAYPAPSGTQLRRCVLEDVKIRLDHPQTLSGTCQIKPPARHSFNSTAHIISIIREETGTAEVFRCVMFV